MTKAIGGGIILISLLLQAVAYEEVKDWPKLPAGVELGEVSGVALDATGHIFVFHRPGRGFDPQATTLLKDPAILEIDAD